MNQYTKFGIALLAPLLFGDASAQEALLINPQGDVGIGTPTPTVPLHVFRNPVAATNLSMFLLENKGGSRFDMRNNNNGIHWFFQNDQDGTFKFSQLGSGGSEIIVSRRLDSFAAKPTLFVDGSVQATNVIYTSSREKKTDFGRIDTTDILDRVAQLDIQAWRYKTEDESSRHIGPVAEDFNALFGFGNQTTSISMVDLNGVALASVQQLAKELAARDVDVVTLKQRLAELEAERDSLEKRLERLELAAASRDGN